MLTSFVGVELGVGARPVQQAGGDLTAHALAQRHALHRLVEDVSQGKAFHEPAEAGV